MTWLLLVTPHAMASEPMLSSSLRKPAGAALPIAAAAGRWDSGQTIFWLGARSKDHGVMSQALVKTISLLSRRPMIAVRVFQVADGLAMVRALDFKPK